MDQKTVERWMADATGRRLHCGDGLYLCRNARGFSWSYIWMAEGRRREHGLGAYGDAMKLREARWSCAGFAKDKREGVDLVERAKAERREVEARERTFADVAAIFVRDVGSRTWKADRQRAEFERIVRTYCKSIATMPIRDVGVAEVKRCIEPLVKTRPTMAKATASVIRRVIDTAIAHEWRPLGVNPASDDVLSKVVVVRHKTTHFGSMRAADVPAFYRSLPTGVVGNAYRLLILTALRKTELLGLRWDEVDLDAGLLTIRADRMKAGREHVVPLSTQALALLRTLPQGAGRFVFPSPKRKGQSLGATAFVLLSPEGATPHGFRATFRSWAEDHGHDDGLAERALAHALTDGVQKAYRRSTAVERRRALMQEWSDYIAG